MSCQRLARVFSQSLEDNFLVSSRWVVERQWTGSSAWMLVSTFQAISRPQTCSAKVLGLLRHETRWTAHLECLKLSHYAPHYHATMHYASCHASIWRGFNQWILWGQNECHVVLSVAWVSRSYGHTWFITQRFPLILRLSSERQSSWWMSHSWPTRASSSVGARHLKGPPVWKTDPMMQQSGICWPETAWYHCSLSLLTFNVCVCNDLSLTTVTSNTSTTSPRWSPWDSRETKTSKRSCGSSQACHAWGRSAWCLNSLNRVKTFVWKPIVRKTKVFRLCSFVVLCRHWLAPSFAAYSVCLAACQTEQSSVGLCVAACDTEYLLRAWDHFWVPAQGIGMDIEKEIRALEVYIIISW